MKRLLILLCLLALTLSACGLESGKSTYTATASMYVDQRSAGDQTGMISSSDTATSQPLINTYIIMLKSDNVLDKVAQELGQDGLDADALREMITAEAEEDSSIIYIHVTADDPQLAIDIANTMLDVAPGCIMEIVGASTIKPIDYAKKAT